LKRNNARFKFLIEDWWKAGGQENGGGEYLAEKVEEQLGRKLTGITNSRRRETRRAITSAFTNKSRAISTGSASVFQAGVFATVPSAASPSLPPNIARRAGRDSPDEQTKHSHYQYSGSKPSGAQSRARCRGARLRADEFSQGCVSCTVSNSAISPLQKQRIE
jgi:hypothetical protein